MFLDPPPTLNFSYSTLFGCAFPVQHLSGVKPTSFASLNSWAHVRKQFSEVTCCLFWWSGYMAYGNNFCCVLGDCEVIVPLSAFHIFSESKNTHVCISLAYSAEWHVWPAWQVVWQLSITQVWWFTMVDTSYLLHHWGVVGGRCKGAWETAL